MVSDIQNSKTEFHKLFEWCSVTDVQQRKKIKKEKRIKKKKCEEMEAKVDTYLESSKAFGTFPHKILLKNLAAQALETYTFCWVKKLLAS